jgi:diguanylate cyclase (GGDEF)-like protein
MRFHKSEILFLVFMALVLAATGLVYLASDELNAAQARMVNTPFGGVIQPVVLRLYMACAALLVSAVLGAVMLYPLIRNQAKRSGELQQMARRLTEKSETYQQAALTDSLTGLQNRRYFDDALAEYLEEFGRIGRPIGVMIIDLDHFKLVNDTHGHDVGDEVLKQLGNCLMEFTRFHDIAARLGGEEFAVVAPNLDGHALMKLAERIRIAVSDLHIVSGNVHLRVTASIGIASWDGVEDGASLVKRADANLYQAKHSGRNRVAA